MKRDSSEPKRPRRPRFNSDWMLFIAQVILECIKYYIER